MTFPWMQRNEGEVRLSLPSKGRLAQAARDFLARCGLEIDQPNPRQYQAHIPALPGLVVLFQRAGDIVVSVREGSVDLGITGRDMVEERKGEEDRVLILHDALGFGHCALTVAVPEAWAGVETLADLARYTREVLGRSLRVATKFPRLTSRFLARHRIPHHLVVVEGALENAPIIGYADAIADLVTTGQTLRDNRLRPLRDGVILTSQAVLIGNRENLKRRAPVLQMALRLLEYIEARLRAEENYLVIANVRGESAEAVAQRVREHPHIRGLQGPTIAPVYDARGSDAPSWYSISIVVRKGDLHEAIRELRAIGGSGVIVTPVRYIFEEEPPRCKALLQALQEDDAP